MKKKTKVISVAVGLTLVMVILIGLVLSGGKSSPDLTLDPGDIIVEWEYDRQILCVRSCACNRTDDDWKGTVRVEIYNTDNELIYTSPAAIWPKVRVKPGEELWLTEDVPLWTIKGRYSGGIVVIRWSWGSQKIEREFRIYEDK